jgi:hypothetical protein
MKHDISVFVPRNLKYTTFNFIFLTCVFFQSVIRTVHIQGRDRSAHVQARDTKSHAYCKVRRSNSSCKAVVKTI